MEVRHWSRETHGDIDIPPWGLVRTAPNSATLVCDLDSTQALHSLIGLDLQHRIRLIEDQFGDVAWYGDSNPEVCLDRWHVQCIESGSIEAKNGVFDE